MRCGITESTSTSFCTLNAANADHPVEVYRFFSPTVEREFIKFIPIIERVEPEQVDATLATGAKLYAGVSADAPAP